jgi:hypothetical protein
LVAFANAAVAGQHLGTVSRYDVIALSALAIGVQNATARSPAAAERTTTVLRQTPTAIVADSRLGGGTGAPTAPRVLAVVAMLFDTTVGALPPFKLAPVASSPPPLTTGPLLEGES